MKSLKEALGILLEEQYAPYLVSNLYLRLFPEDRVNKKYLTIFKDMVKAQKENLKHRKLDKEVHDSVLEDFEKMGEFLSVPENLDGCRGIAMFSCSAKN
ncbi:MAG: peptide chain release factor 1, partial [Sulfurihydrogenibium sp.]|nr:peptide chain release factor 1 [Sulfurihydrogenibium sp.]